MTKLVMTNTMFRKMINYELKFIKSIYHIWQHVIMALAESRPFTPNMLIGIQAVSVLRKASTELAVHFLAFILELLGPR